MWFKPSTEVVSSKADLLPGLVAWVDFGINNMTLRQRHSQYVVDVSRKALEAGLVAKKAMDVDQK